MVLQNSFSSDKYPNHFPNIIFFRNIIFVLKQSLNFKKWKLFSSIMIRLSTNTSMPETYDIENFQKKLPSMLQSLNHVLH